MTLRITNIQCYQTSVKYYAIDVILPGATAAQSSTFFQQWINSIVTMMTITNALV